MSSRLKEDEKNERIIRGLLKQPANRKCINCNILGPQYVCTTFSTFICTTCSGIHREFTHRVKSVSMAKFTPQEIASLQAGGNERAKEIYFKEWDPQRHSAPDSSNVYKLRDFVKHVYVDRRYTGERSVERPPQDEKEEPNENRRSDAYRSGSPSPPYERRYGDRRSPSHDVKRSPGYDQDDRRHSDYGRSPARSGVVNYWRREDRFANGRKFEDWRSSDGESKPEIRSPDRQKDSNMSSPPMVRPVRDILGENVIPLRISEPPRANSSRVADSSSFTQRTVSSSSLASSNGNPAELKRETSLIDFDAEPEPPLTAAATHAQQSTATQSVGKSMSTPSEDNWACFDNTPEAKMSQAPPNLNSLESVLTQLSVPAPANVSGSFSTRSTPPSNGMLPSSTTGDFLFASSGNASTATFPGAPVASPITSLSSFPPGGASAAAPGQPSMFPVTSGIDQWSGVKHQQQPLPHVAVSQPGAPQWASSFPSGSSSQGLTNNTVVQASQPAPTPAAQMVEVKSTGRKELPADIFTVTYSSIPYQAPGWHAGLVPGMGFPMQYNPAMSMPTFPQPIISFNPFDVNAEASPVQAAAFPSMSSLHAALPNMAAPSLGHTPNLGTAAPSLITPQSSYPSAMPPLVPSFGSAMPGTYMGQQLHSHLTPSRPQGFGSFAGEGTTFGSLNQATATPNPPLGGNPFG